MSWICGNCGEMNSTSALACIKCSLDRETALVVNSRKRQRKMCPVCFHRHQEGVYCHVYCQGIIDEDTNLLKSEFFVEEEEEDEDNDESTNDVLEKNIIQGNIRDMSKLIRELNEAKAKEKEKKLKSRPLVTPSYLDQLGYVRCNCKEGVPSNNRMYDPIPNPWKAGNIFILSYDRIISNTENEYRKFSSYDEKLAYEKAQKNEIQEMFSPMLPMVLEYLKIPECHNAPVVNSHWNRGVSLYKDYIDLRDCVPYFAYRLYKGMVDSLFIHNHLLFSGGDRKIIASDYRTGKTLAMITRTSGEIPLLSQFHDELFYSDVNGALRTSQITFDPANMVAGQTLWDHTRSVTKVLWNLPCIGVCEMHGIMDHVCTMFSCSEDRSIRVWNTSNYECIKILDTKSLRTSSFLSMIQSGRHLFVGTTSAKIAVFSKHNFCEREDIHNCSKPGSDKSYCLQVTLKLPDNKLPSGNPPGVTQLLVAGPNYEFSLLWAGDSTGQLTIWSVPQVGLDFEPLKTWHGHDGSVRGLANTWRNALSVGDDGMLVIYDLQTLEKMRRIDVCAWCGYRGLMDRPEMPRAIKSLAVQEDFEYGGVCIVGTSIGDIVIMNIGTQM